MSVGISHNFKDGYINRLRGNGSLVYRQENHIVKCISPSGLDNGSMLDWSFPVYDGDIIEFEIYGRNIIGTNRIGIDFMDVDGLGEQYIPFVWEEVTGSEFKRYRLKTTVPFGKELRRARVVLGVWNSISTRSESEFTRPLLKVHSSMNGFQTIATGLVSLVNGKYTINKNFKHFGFESFEYDVGLKEVKVKLKYGADNASRPVIQATATPDNVYTPLVGRWNSGDRTFSLAFTNGTEKIDLSTGIYYVYIEVKG